MTDIRNFLVLKKGVRSVSESNYKDKIFLKEKRAYLRQIKKTQTCANQYIFWS